MGAAGDLQLLDNLVALPLKPLLNRRPGLQQPVQLGLVRLP